MKPTVQKKIKCRKCNGDGFTAEHDSPDNHGPDGECLHCPIQVQCDECEATGFMKTKNTVQKKAEREKKLYIIGPSGGGEGIYYLISEDGEGLASHFCSGIRYALGDLEADRPERQEEWKREFGDYKVLFIGDDEMTQQELGRRNEQFHRKP